MCPVSVPENTLIIRLITLGPYLQRREVGLEGGLQGSHSKHGLSRITVHRPAPWSPQQGLGVLVPTRSDPVRSGTRTLRSPVVVQRSCDRGGRRAGRTPHRWGTSGEAESCQRCSLWGGGEAMSYEANELWAMSYVANKLWAKKLRSYEANKLWAMWLTSYELRS